MDEKQTKEQCKEQKAYVKPMVVVTKVNVDLQLMAGSPAVLPAEGVSEASASKRGCVKMQINNLITLKL